MARVIRDQWVWKRQNRWWRQLPRRDDSHPKMSWADEDVHEMIAQFPEPMAAPPPKLWVAWLYRDDWRKQGRQIGDQVRMLFGKNPQPGEMAVFPNTASTNVQLWKIKHLLEIRPMTFPNGEPRPEDAPHLEILADGRCLIDPERFPDPRGVELFDPRRQFSDDYLTAFLQSRDWGTKDVYEDTVYNPQNISIID